MASYKIRTAGNCPAVLFTIWSPFNIRIGRGNSLPIRLLQAGHSPLRQRKLESDAEGRWSDRRSRRAILHRHDDYAAAIRKSGPEIKNRCSNEAVSGQSMQRFPNCPPQIKNHCTQVAVNRENLASIPKSEPEIKNRCTEEGGNGENLASILKSGPEIKNRCTQQGIKRTAPSR